MPQQIMVIDDDPNALRLISYALHREGFEVLAAQSGSEALQMIAGNHIDLIILDVMMPRMDGYEVCERFRGNPATARLPIIMLTAKSQVEDKVRGFRAGADDYVTKPVLPAELVARVRALLVRANYLVHPDTGHKARTIAFLGAKGGVGTTTVAINVALAVAERGKSVLLADLNLSAGTVAMQLGLQPLNDNLIPLLTDPEKKPNARTVSSALLSHASGLKLLPAPARVDAPKVVPTPERIRAIIEELRSQGDYLLLDLGASLTSVTLTAVALADRIAIVTESDPLSIDMVQETAVALRQRGLAGGGIEVVMVNRTRSATVVSKADAEQRLDLKLCSVIIPAPEMCFQANRNRIPIMISQPGNLTVEQLRELGEHLCD